MLPVMKWSWSDSNSQVLQAKQGKTHLGETATCWSNLPMPTEWPICSDFLLWTKASPFRVVTLALRTLTKTIIYWKDPKRTAWLRCLSLFISKVDKQITFYHECDTFLHHRVSSVLHTSQWYGLDRNRNSFLTSNHLLRKCAHLV